MTAASTPFPLLQDEASRFEDERGWLRVLYESETTVLKQSFSKKGVFRGLHAQMAPSPQVKLIRVAEGRITDFVVDLNDRARTVHHRDLNPNDGWVRIDAQYAHGFYAREDTIFEYVCDGRYDEPSEQAFNMVDWLAKTMAIADPLLSAKDRAAPPLHPEHA